MRAQRWILIVAVVLGVGYFWLKGGFVGMAAPQSKPASASQTKAPAPAPATARAPEGNAIATFAAGCFWCTEADFDKVPGVLSTTSGYTGGHTPNPTYRQVGTGGTGHAESVEIVYDPKVVTFEQLLDHYWHNVDPFSARGQFCDFGSEYRPVIFVHDAKQRGAAEASKARMQKMFKEPIVVEIVDAGPFYRAEEYHQDYHARNDAQYRFYRWGCGRDARLSQIWGKKGT